MTSDCRHGLGSALLLDWWFGLDSELLDLQLNWNLTFFKSKSAKCQTRQVCNETKLLTSYQSSASSYLKLVLINFPSLIFTPKLVGIQDCLTVEMMDFSITEQQLWFSCCFSRIQIAKTGTLNACKTKLSILSILRATRALPWLHSDDLNHWKMTVYSQGKRLKIWLNDISQIPQQYQTHAGEGTRL